MIREKADRKVMPIPCHVPRLGNMTDIIYQLPLLDNPGVLSRRKPVPERLNGLLNEPLEGNPLGPKRRGVLIGHLTAQGRAQKSMRGTKRRLSPEGDPAALE